MPYDIPKMTYNTSEVINSTGLNTNWTTPHAPTTTGEDNYAYLDNSAKTWFPVDESVLEVLNLVFDIIVTQTFCVTGIVGNFISIIIFWKLGFKDVTNIILISLSTSDTIFCLFQCYYRLPDIVEMYDRYTGHTMRTFHFVYCSFIHQTAIIISLFLVVLISVERCIAVWLPFRVSQICNRRNIIWAVVFLYVLGIVLTLPALFLYRLKWYVSKPKNITYAALFYTDFFANNFEILLIYFTSGLNSVTAIIPLIVIVVLSYITSAKLIVSQRNRKNLSSAKSTPNSRDVKVFRMFITICVVNVLIFLPTTVLDMYLYSSPDQEFLSENFKTAVISVKNAVYTFGPTANWIVYASLSSKFAESYRNMFCFGKLRKK
ncbi:N-formyl peptide receptor 3-like [Physella acuta]|uniref:N-formyl peptide receptor 3-like n=1 Tax=Physella acuta TaxID=109671 RepID=UPI0027DC77A5|nr:N-formyl peptide receptor 3-like [Physella acuta]